MLKNITLSADEELIKKAREKSAFENTTLNATFRQWLAQYTNSFFKNDDYDRLMSSLSYVNPGQKFDRDQLNER
ncbi:MAG: hypothetical protein JRK53_26035 [Deltaproteobacteria bacterium]|nr:hypothetical protein [Deltaproteobacteria bacterium]MBW1815544.1 hypothetical protein [Deltaproteobacteria bacterium]